MTEIAKGPETCDECGALMGNKAVHADWHAGTLDARIRKVSGQVQELAEKARKFSDRSNPPSGSP